MVKKPDPSGPSGESHPWRDGSKAGRGASNRAVLRVNGTGIGIAAEHLPHIFERFDQVDSARASGGCGPGLSICRWIARSHQGTIRAHGTPGEGTAFTVDLPMMRRKQGDGTDAQ